MAAKPFPFAAGDVVEVFGYDWANPIVLPNGAKTAEQRWMRGTVTEVGAPSEPSARSKGGVRDVKVRLDNGQHAPQMVGPRGGNKTIRRVVS